MVTDRSELGYRVAAAAVRHFHSRPEVLELLALQVELRLVLSWAAGRQQTPQAAAWQIAGPSRHPATRAYIAVAAARAHAARFEHRPGEPYNNAAEKAEFREVDAYNTGVQS